jgi:hypothetical protein
VLAIGRELMMARSVLGQEHPFQRWLAEQRFPFSRRSAYRYMDAAKDACASVAHAQSALDESARNLRATRSPTAARDPNASPHLKALVAKLRAVDLRGEDPQAIADELPPEMRAALAAKARALVEWLTRLVDALEEPE